MGETEADRLLRRQLEAAEAVRRQERDAAGERARREEARVAREALEKDRDAAALIQVLLGMLKRLEYAGMEPVEIQSEHRARVPGKRKIRNHPKVVKAGWRLGEKYHSVSWTPEYGDPKHNTYAHPVYLLSDGRIVVAVNYCIRPDGTVAYTPQPSPPGYPAPYRDTPSWYVPLEDGTDAFLVQPGSWLERLRNWHAELNKRMNTPDADPGQPGSLAHTNMYEQVKEAYERAAVGAEQARREEDYRSADERARQQREAELKRYAARFASALKSRDGQCAVGATRHWPLYEETPVRSIPIEDYPRYGADPSYYSANLRPRAYRYELGEDGEFYLNGALVEGLMPATMDRIEGGLVNLALRYRLDPDLFRADDR